jgi:lysophospholipase L1-like esterase
MACLRPLRFAAFCFLICRIAGAGTGDFYLHDGDTVVFYGDSITNQRLYTDFTEAYVLTRFPKLHIRFIHSGFSGDRVSGGFGGGIDERLWHDVFTYHPTVVTVMLGMNDGEYQPYDQAIFKKFADGYRYLMQRVKFKLPKARLTLLEPSAYDDVTRPPEFEGGYNSVLVRFGEFVRELAKSGGDTSGDLNSPVVSLLRNAFEAAPQTAQHLIPDRVHPSAAVHLVMAEGLLKAWHAPAVVTSVELDAARGVVMTSENTAVDQLSAKGGLSWTQTDQSLPMPLDIPDNLIELALRSSDLYNALDREMLTVRGLPAGEYRLRIDDAEVGRFVARDLAAGINLATLMTPMSRQAQKVLDLTHRHNNLHFARWRMVETALKDYSLTKMTTTLQDLDALEDEVIAQQRTKAIPKPHQYRLEPVSAN